MAPFVSLYGQLKETGIFAPRKRVRWKPMARQLGTLYVLFTVQVDPRIIPLDISLGSSMSKSSILEILHQNIYHLFHVSVCQEHYRNDFQNPAEFCT